VVKLDMGGETKRVKVHLAKMQLKHDEWIEVDSPRLAPLYSKTPAPSKKESVGSTAKKQSTSSKKDKVSKGAKGDYAKKALPLNDDGGKQRGGITDCESARSKYDESSDLISTPQAESNPLSTPATQGDLVVSKRQSNAVTDESSPDDSQRRMKSEKAKENSSVWTIPRKNSSPIKTSLLKRPPNLNVAEIASKTTDSPPSKEKSGMRIPRKKLLSPDKQAGLLLQNVKDLKPAPPFDKNAQITQRKASHPPKPSDRYVENHRRHKETELGSPSARHNDSNRKKDSTRYPPSEGTPQKIPTHDHNDTNGSQDKNLSGLYKDAHFHEKRKYRDDNTHSHSGYGDDKLGSRHDSRYQDKREHRSDYKIPHDRSGRDNYDYNHRKSHRDSQAYDNRRYRDEDPYDRWDYDHPGYDRSDYDDRRYSRSCRESGYDHDYDGKYNDSGYDDEKNHWTYRDSYYDDKRSYDRSGDGYSCGQDSPQRSHRPRKSREIFKRHESRPADSRRSCHHGSHRNESTEIGAENGVSGDDKFRGDTTGRLESSRNSSPDAFSKKHNHRHRQQQNQHR
jgi:hypothetical protein